MGPDGSFESRTAICPFPEASSTQSPLPILRVDFRQLSKQLSAFLMDITPIHSISLFVAFEIWKTWLHALDLLVDSTFCGRTHPSLLNRHSFVCDLYRQVYLCYWAFVASRKNCQALAGKLITGLSRIMESRTRILPLSDATSTQAPLPTLRRALRQPTGPSLS